MSNFKGHNCAGILVAGGLSGVLLILHPKTLPPTLILGGALCTYLFALFPDLDTKSTPSKVFYAALIVLLGWLYIQESYKVACLMAMLGMLPQLTSHRGFLHSRIASFLIPGVLLGLYPLGLVTSQAGIFLSFCGVLGYKTHLLLDGIL